MKVDVQEQDSPLTSGLSVPVIRRLQCLLTRRSDRLQNVDVLPGDKNGQIGGIDQFWRIQACLLNAPVAVIGDIGLDIYRMNGCSQGETHEMPVLP